MRRVTVVITPIDGEPLADYFFPRTFTYRASTHAYRIYERVTDAEPPPSFHDVDGRLIAEIITMVDDENGIFDRWIRIDAEMRRRRSRVH